MPTSAQWLATPNKVDHLTRGFTSKVIFNYEYTGGVSVANGDEVFNIITNSFGKNYKGTNALPANYFAGDDGRTFKISMYFLHPLDENDIDVVTRLYDVTNNTNYDFNFDYVGPTAMDTGNAFVKYEVYLSYFKETGGPTYVAEAVGSMIYGEKANGGQVRIVSLNVANTLNNGTSPVYRIQIRNNGVSTITPLNLVIEEIS